MSTAPLSPGRPIRILIADDHAMVRTGISTWIESKAELQLVGEAASGAQAVEQARRLLPDVVLMDLVMPGDPPMDGVAATRAILAERPQTRVLIVTSFSEKERAIEAMRAGACGFILKDTSPQEMLEAIVSVAKGRSWVSAEMARALFQPDPQPVGGDEGQLMTERELEVLLQLAQGLSDQEIADRLVVSKSTVRFHINNILTKLNLENRTQAALWAIKSGLMHP